MKALNELKSDKDIFYYITNKLIQQNQKCADDKGCCYKNNGLSCAIGHLIPNEDYNKSLEDFGLNYYYFEKSEDKKNYSIIYNIICKAIGRKLSEKDCELCIELQIIHDVYEPDEWVTEFFKLAREYKYV